ncbi:MAG: hypothetical protein A2Z14_02015 [Chloroflexi bacterium RBG_16_48_8]|nr:MAG: hypothetical protein A2Z14_02015 [Chloroflexi bacterium RBG_16_48_8]
MTRSGKLGIRLRRCVRAELAGILADHYVTLSGLITFPMRGIQEVVDVLEIILGSSANASSA